MAHLLEIHILIIMKCKCSDFDVLNSCDHLPKQNLTNVCLDVFLCFKQVLLLRPKYIFFHFNRLSDIGTKTILYEFVIKGFFCFPKSF